jgi:hypothetical protein
MSSAILPLTQLPAWQALEDHHQKTKNVHLRRFFADNPQRGTRFMIEDASEFRRLAHIHAIPSRDQSGKHATSPDERVSDKPCEK